MKNSKPCLANFLRSQCVVILLFLGVLQSGSTLATPTTPTTDFTDNGDGTVMHKTTGLTWKRCTEGQTWTGSTCSGTAQTYTWAQATALTGSFAGKNDWRLPTIRELSTITELDATNPSINTAIFPNTSASEFWSASAYVGSSGSAWSVDFSYGYDDSYYDKVRVIQARLVRGGQSSGLLALNRPTTDYVDHGDGTVTHTPTALTWKLCAEGQTWSGSTCSGAALTYTWAQAMALTGSFAGKSDWRLPTQTELRSLVDFTKVNPSINTTIFPNASTSGFWSASSIADWSTSAWVVGLGTGIDGSNNKTASSSYQVRLVRGGQSVSPSSHGPDCLFNWAEGYAPANFSPAGSASQTLGAYYYRYYAKSDSYLASSNDGNIYYLGKNTGLVNFGPQTQWYATAGCQP